MPPSHPGLRPPPQHLAGRPWRLACCCGLHNLQAAPLPRSSGWKSMDIERINKLGFWGPGGCGNVPSRGDQLAWRPALCHGSGNPWISSDPAGCLVGSLFTIPLPLSDPLRRSLDIAGLKTLSASCIEAKNSRSLELGSLDFGISESHDRSLQPPILGTSSSWRDLQGWKV